MHGVVLVKQEKQGRGLGYTRGFYDAVRKINGVTDAYPVFGRFDDVVFFETKDYETLLEQSGRVLGIPGVKSTETIPERY